VAKPFLTFIDQIVLPDFFSNDRSLPSVVA